MPVVEVLCTSGGGWLRQWWRSIAPVVKVDFMVVEGLGVVSQVESPVVVVGSSVVVSAVVVMTVVVVVV